VPENFRFELRTYIFGIENMYNDKGSVRLLTYHIASFPSLPIVQAVFATFTMPKMEKEGIGVL